MHALRQIYKTKPIETLVRFTITFLALSLLLAGCGKINHYERGVQSVNNQEWDKAITDFSEAIKLNPTNGSAFVYRGSAFFMLGKFDGAIDDYNQAIRINKNDCDAAFNLAGVYRAKGEFNKSIDSWDAYIRLNPTNDLAYKSRASVYSAMGRYDEALKDWNEGLRLDSKDSTALAERSIAYFKTSQFDKAERDAIDAVRLGPTNGFALNCLAWFRATCPVASFRNGKEAVEAATKACELAGWTRWQWIDTLAAAFAEAGDFAQAINFEKRALKISGLEDKDRNKLQKFLSLYEHQQSNHDGHVD